MSNDMPGKIIGIILAFVLAVIVPFVNTTVEQEMLDRRSIVMDVTNFIDEVVDSRQISDSMIRELNTKISSYGMTVDYTITHYRQSVNPDPVNPDKYYSNYVVIDNAEEWQRGDRIEVHVYTLGYSTAESIAHKITGMFIQDLDRTFASRIR